MQFFLRWTRGLAPVIALALAIVSFPLGFARAALVGTQEVIAEAAGEAQREKVIAFLQRDEVREQMVALGVAPEEVEARIATLSDAEIETIAGQLDELPAGQDALGTVLGVALVIFVILLITDLLGLTDVFPFVRR